MSLGCRSCSRHMTDLEAIPIFNQLKFIGWNVGGGGVGGEASALFKVVNQDWRLPPYAIKVIY